MPLGQRPLLPPRPRLLRPVTTAAFVATTLQALATPSRLLILTTPRQRPYPVADCAADFVSRVTARNRLPLDYSERSLRIVDFLIDGLRKGGA